MFVFEHQLCKFEPVLFRLPAIFNFANYIPIFTLSTVKKLHFIWSFK